MDDYFRKWNDIIANCSFSNTYKMAWAKAIVEVCESAPHDVALTIFFEDLAPLILKYYWNQTVFFDLVQGSSLAKPPEVMTTVNGLAESWYSTREDRQPVRWEKVDFPRAGLETELALSARSVVNTLKKDVCYRFPRLGSKDLEVYSLNRKGWLELRASQVSSLKQHADLLYQVINYRWTQMLESYNNSPRISTKVRAIDDDTVPRSSLTPFREFLDFGDDEPRCFYTGIVLDGESLSIDHVIPWSFMFSDDLWNLVYCHQSENSRKSNRVPAEEDIRRLESRNTALYERLQESELRDKKRVRELGLAIERDWVRQFWIACRG